MKITVILTVYKRVDYLEKQINSLLNQIVKPDKFIINVNNIEQKERYTEIINRLIPDALIVENSQNLGVWSRFFL
jgi:GT2 family glycosyltransferase